MQYKLSILSAVILLACFPSFAAEPVLGPTVKDFGPVFAVPQGSYNLESDQQYKIVMDIAKGPDDPSDLNRGIESAARFLNMHARNGIKPENLQLAIVLHGSGARAALNEQAHSKHFDVANGSGALIEALGNAGVEIYLCGQTAGYYGYGLDDLLPQVTMAVSAMTAHVRLQQEGYQGILF